MGAIPIVNENDTISTYEIEFGDNDTLSAVVSAMVGADLLILLSDIDGLFTDDPHKNPEAKFIDVVEELDEHLLSMGKGSTGSNVGTGGMATKLTAAEIASAAGTDMIIANGADFHVIHKIMQGRAYGTLFLSHKKNDFLRSGFSGTDTVKGEQQHGSKGIDRSQRTCQKGYNTGTSHRKKKRTA